jgi:hypothetical protein
MDFIADTSLFADITGRDTACSELVEKGDWD